MTISTHYEGELWNAAVCLVGQLHVPRVSLCGLVTENSTGACDQDVSEPLLRTLIHSLSFIIASHKEYRGVVSVVLFFVVVVFCCIIFILNLL